MSHKGRKRKFPKNHEPEHWVDETETDSDVQVENLRTGFTLNYVKRRRQNQRGRTGIGPEDNGAQGGDQGGAEDDGADLLEEEAGADHHGADLLEQGGDLLQEENGRDVGEEDKDYFLNSSEEEPDCGVRLSGDEHVEEEDDLDDVVDAAVDHGDNLNADVFEHVEEEDDLDDVVDASVDHGDNLNADVFEHVEEEDDLDDVVDAAVDNLNANDDVEFEDEEAGFYLEEEDIYEEQFVGDANEQQEEEIDLAIENGEFRNNVGFLVGFRVGFCVGCRDVFDQICIIFQKETLLPLLTLLLLLFISRTVL